MKGCRAVLEHRPGDGPGNPYGKEITVNGTNRESTTPPRQRNAPTLSAVSALIDKQAAELRAVAETPFQRALVACMAVQAIRREMGEASR